MEKLKEKMAQELSKIEERTGKIDNELREVQASNRTINKSFCFQKCLSQNLKMNKIK